MNRKELIKKYLEFFKSKNHKEIPNSSLIPKEDPTVLFTTAGMHPLVPYLLGQKHPLGKRLCGIQRCVRTGDIDEVGDETHHTFFEMLGNWSLGDYGKKEAIEYSFEFLTKILKIPKEKLAVTIFAGDKNAPKDNESNEIWKNLGINKIKFLGKEDNWWGPAGETGPCGPDTEMFVNGVEIWNNVFMEYEKNKNGNYSEAKQKNVDTGMGVERTLAVLNGFDDNYLTEVWKPIIQEIEKLSGKKYKGNEKAMRIIADHIKASVFIIADGIIPGNKEQGYVLRRLIRRAVYYGKEIGISNISRIAKSIFKIYNDYEELKKNEKHLFGELDKEEQKFSQTLEKGLNEFNKLTKDEKKISGANAFLLRQSFGYPKELIKEKLEEIGIKFPEKEFEKEFEKHITISGSSAFKFKSGLADTSEKTTKLHTATHLLNEALRKILSKDVKQRGSNITSERLRFDFSFDRKLTLEEIKKIEDLVNKKIQENLKVAREEMPLKKAFGSGAQGEFGAKYPEKVSVYTIGNFSKEICTGPHVKNTKELGKFKIIKEESSSAGVRRIKATLN